MGLNEARRFSWCGKTWNQHEGHLGRWMVGWMDGFCKGWKCLLATKMVSRKTGRKISSPPPFEGVFLCCWFRLPWVFLYLGIGASCLTCKLASFVEPLPLQHNYHTTSGAPSRKISGTGWILIFFLVKMSPKRDDTYYFSTFSHLYYIYI